MNFDKVFNIASGIVVLAGVTVVFTSPQTRGVINSLANAFTSSIKAATQQ